MSKGINIVQEKWIIVADNRLVLTLKGFKPVDKVWCSEVRVFASETIAKNHISKSWFVNYGNITYHKVKVTIVEEL